MVVLTSLLPGLREVRGPLTSGFVWLLVLWTAFPDVVADLAASKPLADLNRVVPFLGEGAAFSVLTFVAYLIGAFLYIDIQARPAALLQRVFHPRSTPVSGTIRQSLGDYTEVVVAQAIGADRSARTEQPEAVQS